MAARLFAKKKADPAEDQTENPYTSGRREWNERYGSYIVQRNWGLGVGLAGMLIAAVAVGGAVHIGSQSKFIPVYVLVDKLMQSYTVGRGDFAQIPQPEMVKVQLAKWVADVRSVTPDKVVGLRSINSAYGMIADSSPAKVKLDAWFAGEGKTQDNIVKSKANPFERAASETVETQIQGLPLPISAESWQADWVEIVRDRKGTETGRHVMRVVFTVRHSDPVDEGQIMANPTGTWITDFNWTRQF